MTATTTSVTASTAKVADAGWVRLTGIGALATIISSLVHMAAGRFFGPSLVVLCLGIAVGLVLLPRRPRAGATVAAVFSLANILLHSGLYFLALTRPEVLWLFVVPLISFLGSVACVVAAIPIWARAESRRAPLLLLRGAVVMLVLATIASAVLYATRPQQRPLPGDVVLHHSGLRVDNRSLVAPVGEVTVAVYNADPVSLRSFDVNALDVHLVVPPRTWRRITFSVPAGSYKFHDEITFTDQTGGTLTVR